MRKRAAWIVAVLGAVMVAGCRKDTQGAANLNVQTTLPEGITATLVSVDRPGNYVERSKTDLGGTLIYTRIKPGKYTLVYQFVAEDNVITHLPYHYGESQVIEVKPGRNRVAWEPDTGSVSRLDE